MPRGRTKKAEKAGKVVEPVVEAIKESPAVETRTEQAKTVVSDATVREAPEPVGVTADEIRIRSSRDVLKHPLQAGQKFFEAPDGTIIVGEEDKDHAWYRQGNNGKGCWINPRR